MPEETDFHKYFSVLGGFVGVCTDATVVQIEFQNEHGQVLFVLDFPRQATTSVELKTAVQRAECGV